MSDQLLQRFFRRIKNKEIKIKKVSYEFVLRTLTLASKIKRTEDFKFAVLFMKMMLGAKNFAPLQPFTGGEHLTYRKCRIQKNPA